MGTVDATSSASQERAYRHAIRRGSSCSRYVPPSAYATKKVSAMSTANAAFTALSATASAPRGSGTNPNSKGATHAEYATSATSECSHATYRGSWGDTMNRRSRGRRPLRAPPSAAGRSAPDDASLPELPPPLPPPPHGLPLNGMPRVPSSCRLLLVHGVIINSCLRRRAVHATADRLPLCCRQIVACSDPLPRARGFN